MIGHIVNNCVTDNPNLPLSAAQGKALMDAVNVLNTNQIYITVDGTFLAIRDKKTDTYLAIDAGVPRIDLKTLNGIKHYKLTEI